MAEQLAGQQLPVVEMRTVHSNEWAPVAPAEQVDGADKQILAGARFAGHQHGSIGLGKARRTLKRTDNRLVGTDSLAAVSSAKSPALPPAPSPPPFAR
jgi:hypothetical protein